MALETPARIAVLGAGPIGLEAALYARFLGYEVHVYEAGRVAEHIRRWGHVRMFTPFAANRSPLGLAALRAQDSSYTPPDDDALLSGGEFVERYLAPLARTDLLVDGLHEQMQVLAVGRQGLWPGEDPPESPRDECDFRILLRSQRPADHGRESIATADAVIDATGVAGHPNWLGQGGIPALGEIASALHIEHGIPDVLGSRREQFASRNILLVGEGYYAATNLLALAELATQAPDTWITWVTRQAGDSSHPQRELPAEVAHFPERSRTLALANRLAADDANHITRLTATTIESVEWHADLERFSVQLAGLHAGQQEFDRILANVGYHADRGLCSQLAVGPPSPSVRHPELLQPEPDYYLLGAKACGRPDQFLLSAGLSQIRQLFALIGDRAELDLYSSMKGLY